VVLVIKPRALYITTELPPQTTQCIFVNQGKKVLGFSKSMKESMASMSVTPENALKVLLASLTSLYLHTSFKQF
jgi:hypothetical protein